MKIFVIGAKPATKKALEEISLHDEIVFCKNLDEYRRYCGLRDEELSGKKPTMIIVDDIEPELPKPAVRVAHLGGRMYGRSAAAAVLASFAHIDFAALEARVLAAHPDIVLDSVDGYEALDIKTMILKAMPEPIKPHIAHNGRQGRGRASKGERKGNKRYRWC